MAEVLTIQPSDLRRLTDEQLKTLMDILQAELNRRKG